MFIGKVSLYKYVIKHEVSLQMRKHEILPDEAI